METKLLDFQKYINEKISECQEQEAALIAEERKDEANMWKIKSNIYEIFQTLMKVSVQQNASGGWAAVCESFEEKADRVPSNWKSSYEKAKLHNDVEKILVEEEKLAAATDVMNFYQNLK